MSSIPYEDGEGTGRARPERIANSVGFDRKDPQKWKTSPLEETAFHFPAELLLYCRFLSAGACPCLIRRSVETCISSSPQTLCLPRTMPAVQDRAVSAVAGEHCICFCRWQLTALDRDSMTSSRRELTCASISFQAPCICGASQWPCEAA